MILPVKGELLGGKGLKVNQSVPTAHTYMCGICLWDSHKRMLGKQLIYLVYTALRENPTLWVGYFHNLTLTDWLKTNNFAGYQYSVTPPSRKPNYCNLEMQVSNFTPLWEQQTSTKKYKQTLWMCSRSCDSPLNQNLLHVLPILKYTHFHLKSTHFVLIDTDVIPLGTEYEYA